jgi:hypothetical protein
MEIIQTVHQGPAPMIAGTSGLKPVPDRQEPNRISVGPGADRPRAA